MKRKRSSEPIWWKLTAFRIEVVMQDGVHRSNGYTDIAAFRFAVKWLSSDFSKITLNCTRLTGFDVIHFFSFNINERKQIYDFVNVCLSVGLYICNLVYKVIRPLGLME